MKRRTAPKLVALLGSICIAGSVVAGCSSSSDSSSDTTVAESASASITFTDAWSRSTAAGQTLGVVYMTINNSSDVDDSLLTVTVDPSVASGTEVHESYETGKDNNAAGGPGKSATINLRDSHMAHGGSGHDDPHGIDTSMMGMREVSRIVVPAKGSVTLEPAGYHIMLLDLAKPLVAGEFYDLTLTFENAGQKTVRVPILDRAP
jgi:copper(I)-binding protein